MTDKHEVKTYTFEGNVIEDLAGALDSSRLPQTLDGVESYLNGLFGVRKKCDMLIGEMFCYLRDNPEKYGFVYQGRLKDEKGRFKKITGASCWTGWVHEKFGITSDTVAQYVKNYELFKSSEYANKLPFSTKKYISSIANTVNIEQTSIDKLILTEYTAPRTGNKKQLKDMTREEVRSISKALTEAKKKGIDTTIYKNQESVLQSWNGSKTDKTTDTAELDKLRAELERTKAELAEAQNAQPQQLELDTALHEAELDDLRAQIDRLTCDLKQSTNNNDWLVKQMEAVKAERKQFEAERKQLEAEREQLKALEDNLRKEVELERLAAEESKEDWQKRSNFNKVEVFKSVVNNLHELSERFYFIVADAPLFLDFLNGSDEYADKFMSYERWIDVIGQKWDAHRSGNNGDTIDADYVDVE